MLSGFEVFVNNKLVCFLSYYKLWVYCVVMKPVKEFV